jgi:hypothetical protein
VSITCRGVNSAYHDVLYGLDIFGVLEDVWSLRERRQRDSAPMGPWNLGCAPPTHLAASPGGSGALWCVVVCGGAPRCVAVCGCC